MEVSIAKATEEGVTTRGLVVINPGNPTGQVLDVPTMRQIVQFAHEHDLVLLADEVCDRL
jgi:alanine transaminase